MLIWLAALGAPLLISAQRARKLDYLRALACQVCFTVKLSLDAAIHATLGLHGKECIVECHWKLTA